MKLYQLGRLLRVKYAQTIKDIEESEILEGPDEFSAPLTGGKGDAVVERFSLQELKDKTAAAYKDFFESRRLFGGLDFMKWAYDLPLVRDLGKDFAKFVLDLNSMEGEDFYNNLRLFINRVEDIRNKLDLFIRTNTTHPMLQTATQRKQVMATVERSLENFNSKLERIFNAIKKSDLDTKLIVDTDYQRHVSKVKAPRRGSQTHNQMSSFLLDYGDLYNISPLLGGLLGEPSDWQRIQSKDPALAEKLVTRFLGYRRGAQQVADESLKRQVEKLLTSEKNKDRHKNEMKDGEQLLEDFVQGKDPAPLYLANEDVKPQVKVDDNLSKGIRQFGKLYGINSQEDLSMLMESEPDMAGKLIRKLIDHGKGSSPADLALSKQTKAAVIAAHEKFQANVESEFYKKQLEE